MNMMSENMFLHHLASYSEMERSNSDGGGGGCCLTPGLKMCVTACNRHLLQSHHHIIYTVLNCLRSKSSIHTRYLVSSCKQTTHTHAHAALEVSVPPKKLPPLLKLKQIYLKQRTLMHNEQCSQIEIKCNE